MLFRDILSVVAAAVTISSFFLTCKGTFHIVRREGTGTLYILNKGIAWEISDEKTVERLGFELSNIEDVNDHMLSYFRSGVALDQKADIPPLYPLDETMDEIMRAELTKISLLQTTMIYGFQRMGDYINPSATYWKGRIFMATGLAWGIIEGKPANEHTEFRWVNTSQFPFHTKDKYLGIANQIDQLEIALVGQDPRLLQVDDNTLFVAFTNRFARFVRMGMAEIVINGTGQAELRNVFNTLNPPPELTGNQKNWSPFLYNSSVLLIPSINPLFVLGIDDYSAGENGQIGTTMISQAPKVSVPWAHGSLRGGTNAVFLKDKYLAFFHSENHIEGDWLTTYWMGAYTFSAHPPFRLLSMSPYPVLVDDMYSGPWDPLKNRRIDYCVFVMGLFLDPGDEETLHISYGYNDNEGFLAKIRLKTLLDTLEPLDL